ncbi:LysR substrate-binding domain-containing protein [Chromobacterium sphagni]|uniref:LysR substrate-binding domain-containing protein n=1 Tax=Chromobacterium sphagni TaxID=1903179 RepID=UPI0023D7B8AB|nr:LysR substrate-binding domain-containing protein [Chromobacterium sphagni]
MQVAVRHLEPARLQGQAERGEVDLALISPDCVPPSLHSRPLFDDRYVLIGRRNHPAMQGEITPQRYLALEHVVVSLAGGDFSTAVDTVLAEQGWSRHVALSAASFLFVPDMVAQTDFVSLMPEKLMSAWRGRLTVRECPFPLRAFGVARAQSWPSRPALDTPDLGRADGRGGLGLRLGRAGPRKLSLWPCPAAGTAWSG